MSSVLDRPGEPEGITDADWTTGGTGIVSPPSASLVGLPTNLRRFRFWLANQQVTVESEGPLPAWFPKAITSLNELAPQQTGILMVRERFGALSILSTLNLLASIMRDDTPLPRFVPTKLGALSYWNGTLEASISRSRSVVLVAFM